MKHLTLICMLALVLLCLPTALADDINVTEADVIINITLSTPPDNVLDSIDAKPHEKFNDVFVHLADTTFYYSSSTPPDNVLDSTDAKPQEKFNDVFVHLADATLNYSSETPSNNVLDSTDAKPQEKFNNVFVHLADATLNYSSITPPDIVLDSTDAKPQEKFNDVFVHLADATLNYSSSTPPYNVLDSTDAKPHEKFNDVFVHLADANPSFIPLSPPFDILDYAPPIITITSPVNGTIYTTNIIKLNYSVNEPTTWEGYSIDGSGNVILSGNTTLTGLTDGLHSLTVYANDIAGNIGQNTVWFAINVSMQISETLTPNLTSVKGNVTVSGHVNLSDGTPVPNNPVNIYLNGTIIMKT